MRAMSRFYVTTVQKSTAVTACVTGNFTSSTDLNLILAKNVHLEIYLVTPEGLRPLKEVRIYGKITVIKFFRLPHETKDLLFLLTTRCNAMILECIGEGEDIEIITKAYGNVAGYIRGALKTSVRAVIDPKARVIGLTLYDSFFTIIPLDKDNLELKASSFYMDERYMYDVNFLHGCANPTLIFIYYDINGRHVKTYEINLRDKKICQDTLAAG